MYKTKYMCHIEMFEAFLAVRTFFYCVKTKESGIDLQLLMNAFGNLILFTPLRGGGEN
jgi:hypothetical protein